MQSHVRRRPPLGTLRRALTRAPPPTHTRPAPAQPTHKRKLILASPRGRGPHPSQTRSRRGHGEAEGGPRLSTAAEASRPGLGTRVQPPRTRTDGRGTEAAAHTSESRNAEPTRPRETRLPPAPLSLAPPLAELSQSEFRGPKEGNVAKSALLSSPLPVPLSDCFAI